MKTQMRTARGQQRNYVCESDYDYEQDYDYEIFAPREVERILAAASTPRDRLLLGLLYGCGLKVGEVCSLRWQHVQSETTLIHQHCILPADAVSPLTRVYAAMHKTPPPTQPPKPPPPSILDAAQAALTLVSDSPTRSATFYQVLRTRLRDRFLALTRAIGPP